MDKSNEKIGTDWLRLLNFPSERSPIPTFFIAVGGTGYEIINRVKGKVCYAVEKGLLGEEEARLFKYMWYDPDPSQRDKAERVYLGADDSEWINAQCDLLRTWEDPGETELRTIKGSLNESQRNEIEGIIKDCLSDKVPGFGTTRVLGKAAWLHLGLEKRRRFEEMIRSFMHDLRSFDYRGPVWFVIAASMCGGTGSSTFLDMAAYIRDLRDKGNMRTDTSWVTAAVLVGPEATHYFNRNSSNLPRRPLLRANAYAVLRENNWLRQQKDPYLVRHISGGYGLCYDKMDKAPIQYVFFVDRETEGGHNYKDMKDMSEAISDTLCYLFPGGMLTEWRARITDDERTFRILTRKRGSVLSFLSSFGSASAEVPLDYLATYVYYKLALDWIDDYAAEISGKLGGRSSAEEIRDFLYGSHALSDCLIKKLGLGKPDENRTTFLLDPDLVALPGKNSMSFMKGLSGPGASEERQSGSSPEKRKPSLMDRASLPDQIILPETEKFLGFYKPRLEDYWDEFSEEYGDDWRHSEKIISMFGDGEKPGTLYRTLEHEMRPDLDRLHDTLARLKEDIAVKCALIRDKEALKVESEYAEAKQRLADVYGLYKKRLGGWEGDLEAQAKRSRIGAVVWFVLGAVIGIVLFATGWGLAGGLAGVAGILGAMRSLFWGPFSQLRQEFYELKETQEEQLRNAQSEVTAVIERFLTLELELYLYTELLLPEINRFAFSEIRALEKPLKDAREFIETKLRDVTVILQRGGPPRGTSWREGIFMEKTAPAQSTRRFVQPAFGDTQRGRRGSGFSSADLHALVSSMRPRDFKDTVAKDIWIRIKGRESKVPIHNWAQDIPEELSRADVIEKKEEWVRGSQEQVLSRTEVILRHILHPFRKLVWRDRINFSEERELPWRIRFSREEYFPEPVGGGGAFASINTVLAERGSPAIRYLSRGDDPAVLHRMVLSPTDCHEQFWQERIIEARNMSVFRKSKVPSILTGITILSAIYPSSIQGVEDWHEDYKKEWGKTGYPVHIFPSDVVEKMPDLLSDSAAAASADGEAQA